MKKQIFRLGFGLIILAATLSCGGTTGYYLRTAPTLAPHPQNAEPNTPKLSSGNLNPSEMPYPVIGDIADLASMGGVIYSYNTSARLENTINFYKTELPLQGYILLAEHTSETIATLEFINPTHTLNITLTLNPETNVVNVMMIES